MGVGHVGQNLDIQSGSLGNSPTCRLGKVLAQVRSREMAKRAQLDFHADDFPRAFFTRDGGDLAHQISNKRAFMHVVLLGWSVTAPPHAARAR